MISGEAIRFLAVLVIATPCPLLIAIPVAIIGSHFAGARRASYVKNPAVLEQIDSCRTAIFDKTGTLTYGEPKLAEQLIAPGLEQREVLTLAASLERYSKHPLAAPFCWRRERRAASPASITCSQPPGQGLRGKVASRQLQITSRGSCFPKISAAEDLPPPAGGLECIIVIDDQYAAIFRLRDEPRRKAVLYSASWAKASVSRLMIVSGDRESEVRYLAEQVGINEIHAEQSPEHKLASFGTKLRRRKLSLSATASMTRRR